jgi:hypothetical protein
MASDKMNVLLYSLVLLQIMARCQVSPMNWQETTFLKAQPNRKIKWFEGPFKAISSRHWHFVTSLVTFLGIHSIYAQFDCFCPFTFLGWYRR